MSVTTSTPVTLDGFPAVVSKTEWPRFLSITAWDDPWPGRRRGILLAPDLVERIIANGGAFSSFRNLDPRKVAS